MEKTYTISDLDGSNIRQITLAQFKSEHAEKFAKAREIFARSVAAMNAKKEI